jgi:hypothetical protein
MEWGWIDKRAYATENTKRSDLVKDKYAEPDGNVVADGCSYHVEDNRRRCFGIQPGATQ